MDKPYKLIGILVAACLLLCTLACRQRNVDGAPIATVIHNGETASTDTCSSPDGQPLCDGVILRQPDKRIKARKGHALLLETEGFVLSATDTAVIRGGTYSVTSLYGDELPPLAQGMVNMTAATAGYRLLPGGEHFAPYAELRIAYDPDRLPQGYSPDDIHTSYYDSSAMAWVRLERIEVDTVNHEIVSLTSHFTDFINELLKAPEMPETQAFVPTQISSLEAANPLAGYTVVAPPEANNMGTANLSYPLHVPAGRGGIQPNLTLTYNSNGGNGVCGLGWDLPIPCISVETRWGVPWYDPDYESETYLFNGEQLLVDHDSLPAFARDFHHERRRDDVYTRRFYPRVEGSFDSILRHGTSPQTYWWEVYDRSGTRYIYGLGDGELRSQRKNAVSKWYLTRVIDRDGNVARYHYNVYRNGTSTSKSGTAVYLEKIIYTSPNRGFSPQQWYGYCVSFHYEDRDDCVVNGNLGVKENVSKRLSSVKTWYVKIHPTPLENNNFTIPDNMSDYGHEIDDIKLNSEIEQIGNGEGLLAYVTRLLGHDRMQQADSSLIRGYLLLYEMSSTGKSLLAAAVEMNPDEWDSHVPTLRLDNLINGNTTLKYHRFQYKQLDNQAFGDNNTFQLSSFNAFNVLSFSPVSPLGGSREWRSGFSLSAGVGLDPKSWLRTLNLEVNGSVTTKSSSHGTTLMADINGDGFPDILYKTPYGSWECLYYKPGPSQTPERGTFCRTDVVADNLKEDISKTLSIGGYAVGMSVHAGHEYGNSNIGLNIGAQRTSSTSNNTIYLADVNADGLPDIVKNGNIWFNNSHGSSIRFSRNYQPHVPGENHCEQVYYSYEKAAPMDCKIFEEGHESETYVSSYSQQQDKVTLVGTTTRHVLANEDTDTVYRSVVRVWIAPYEGNIHISGTASLDNRFADARKATGADGVHVSIQHNGTILSGTEHTLNEESGNVNISANTWVDPGDRIYFRVEALKNDLYDVVNWNPVIYYSDRDTSLTDSAYRKRYLFSAKDDFLAWQGDKFHMPASGSVHISAGYSLTRPLADSVSLRITRWDDSLTYIKGNNDTTIIVPPNTLAPSAIPLNWHLDSLDALLFQVSANSEQDWNALQWHPHVIATAFTNSAIPTSTSTLNEDGHSSNVEHTVDVHPSPAYLPVNDYSDMNLPAGFAGLFRSLYRGWGCFTYNSDTMRTPMNENRIHYPDKYNTYSTMPGDSLEPSILNRLGNIDNGVSADSIQAVVATMVPNSEDPGSGIMTAVYDPSDNTSIWVANGYRSFVSASQMGLYNWQSMQATLGDPELKYPVTNASIAQSNAVPLAPVKGSTQKGYGVHASLSAGIKEADTNMRISGCVNFSHGESRVTADYVDMNGDGYPDIVGENDVQYTNSRGGLSNKHAGTVVSGQQGIQRTTYDAASLQGGASYPSYRKHIKSSGTVSIEQRSNGSDISASTSKARSADHITMAWMDMNGDGLPDCVRGDSVYLNLGYDYYGATLLRKNPLPENASETSTMSFGNNHIRDINNSFSAGMGCSSTDNCDSVTYADVNGDGLVDKIANNRDVYFNTGWGFTTNAPLRDARLSSSSEGFSQDLNGNVTIGVPLPFFSGNMKFQGTTGLETGTSTTTTKTTLIDMNADGLPDIVSHNREIIMVYYNQMYALDKLVSVESFYGNKMELEYAQAPHSPRSRHRPTVMSRLAIMDQTGKSNDRRVFTFNYSGYVHSVAERTPYGFDSVIVSQYSGDTLYRITRQHYRTDHYKMRGKKDSERISDYAGRPYVEHRWKHEMKRISDGAVVDMAQSGCYGPVWPALDSSVTIYFNPATGNSEIITAERYIHADSGRLATYVDHGNVATANDDVRCELTHTRGYRNQYALPQRVTVSNLLGHRLRLRTAYYDTIGHLIESVSHINTTDSAPTSYRYDTYGNITSVQLPPNLNGQRTKYIYAYDTLVNSFCVSVTDSAFGLTSRTGYDVRLGVPLRIYSVGGDSISYTYDSWGRPLSVRAPQESDTSGSPTIRYRYWDGALPALPVNRPGFRSLTSFPPSIEPLAISAGNMYMGGPIWAQTFHRSQTDSALNTATAVFADGHGRVLQTQKTAVVDGITCRVASGHIVYDHIGRPATAYEPFAVYNDSLNIYATPVDTGIYTATQYDVLDRVVLKSIPSADVATSIAYGFDSVDGAKCFQTVTTDPEYHSTTTLSDARGVTLKTIDATSAHGVTRFVYDAIGQLVESYDPEGYMTSYAYDLLGRLTYRNHPDAGKCKYLYDPAGNLIQESNMLGDINYDYTYYRLLKKRYSYMTGNDVTYSYRNSGRGAGLPRRITDGSGTMSLEYDAMGRVARSVRMLSVPASAHVYTFTHSYVYDSWNRMIQMTYPDGERVEYHYHPDGTLAGMTGDKGGNLREYISSAEYDKYGKRTKVVYGNGTCAEYSYDSLQRLSVLRSNDGHQHIMQKINYLYDKVGNITMLHNSAGSVDGLGGAYTNTYIYDPLNRLVNASGSGSAEGQQRNFTIDQIAYSPSGRLGVKAQNWDSGTSQGEVVQEYGYSQTDVRPHAPEFIKNQAGDNAIHSLTWDEAGNLVRLSEQRPQGSTYGTRFLGWTVDNRLVTVADWRHYSYYAYDHTGERTLKMTGAVSSGDMNASVQHSVSCLDDITLYPSPFLVVTDHGYTKHYYAGAERVAARLGAGGLNHDSVCVGNNMDAEQTADSLFLEAWELANKMEYRRPTTSDIVQIDGSAIGGLEYFDPDDVPVSMQAEVTINPNRIHETIGTLSPTGEPAHNSEPEVYFYHSDHLGSASWITDSVGDPIQHLQYLPFGEPFVDQRAVGSTYSERFRFTGKEKDGETGYGYYGTRYMDHSLLSSFISVDRYADKYPFISPYAYCAWNPIRLTDPTGDTCVFASDVEKNYIMQLLDSKSDNYSKEFSDVFHELDKDSYTYIFESWQGDKSSDGRFTPSYKDQKTALIQFTMGETKDTRNKLLGMSEYKILFEETFHAWKYKNNDHRNVSTCYSEALAWQFSASAPGTSLFNTEIRDLTVMGYISLSDPHILAKEFKFGFINNKYPQKPLYPNLDIFPDNRLRKNLGLPEWH